VLAALTLLLAVAAAAGAYLAWTTQQRLKLVEQQIVKRQQDVADRAAEARTLAAQAEAVTRDAAAKVALLEARVAEASLQRAQVDEMLRNVVSSREDNLLAELEGSLRVALQHAAITASLEPVVAALVAADERLGRLGQPRMERIRLAIAKDLDRLRAASTIDLPGLAARLDEMARLVDELPMLAVIDARGAVQVAAAGVPRGPAALAPSASSAPSTSAAPAGPDAASPGAQADPLDAWLPAWAVAIVRPVMAWGQRWFHEVGATLAELVRVTRIDQPEAALLAPEQAWFVRENLKLRLLDARLALLGRQFELSRGTLVEAQSLLERYFDPGSRRVAAAVEQLRQMADLTSRASAAQADETLAAIATALALR
jgi:uroporphyrin-3 C-methyltransferase